jgi:hypothetical protein
MRQTHLAGDKLFVDTVPLFDSATGKNRHAHIYVAALGASELHTAVTSRSNLDLLTGNRSSDSHANPTTAQQTYPSLHSQANVKASATRHLPSDIPIASRGFLNAF